MKILTLYTLHDLFSPFFWLDLNQVLLVKEIDDIRKYNDYKIFYNNFPYR